MELFTKMQGLGNRFVIKEGPLDLSSEEVAILCKKEHVDGLLIVTPLDERKVKMKYWNADGSRAEMCGNGLRCVTRFAIDNNLIESGEFMVETDAGPLNVFWDGCDYTKIDTQIGKVKIEENFIQLHGLNFYIVNVGNPHAVTFVDDVKAVDVKTIGSLIENDDYFPKKTNVEFVEVTSNNHIKLRTWERGVGETTACATGMAASASVASKFRNINFPMKIEALGGSVRAEIDNESYTRLVGPAEYISDN